VCTLFRGRPHEAYTPASRVRTRVTARPESPVSDAASMQHLGSATPLFVIVRPLVAAGVYQAVLRQSIKVGQPAVSNTRAEESLQAVAT